MLYQSRSNQIKYMLFMVAGLSFIALTAYQAFIVIPVESISKLSLLMTVMFILTVVFTIKPNFAMPILIVSVFFSPDIVVAQIPGRDVNLRVEDGVIVAVLAGLFIRYVFNGERIFKPTLLDKPIIAYLAVGFISTLFGAFFGNMTPATGLFFFGKRVEYFALFYILIRCFEGKRDIKQAIYLVFICIFIISVYNVYMRATSNGVGQWRGYSAVGDEDIVLYADIITLILPIMIAIAVETRSVSFIILAVITIGPAVFTTLDSLSRHSYVGGAVALLFLGIYRYHYMLPIMAGSIIYLSRRLPENIVGRMNFLWLEISTYFKKGSFIQGGSFDHRVRGVEEAFNKLLYNPIFGSGLGSYNMASVIGHTQYSYLLAETGILGLGAFLWFILSAMIQAFRHIKITEDRLYRGFFIGYVAGLIGWLVASTAALNFAAIRTMECFIILTSILVICLKDSKSDNLTV